MTSVNLLAALLILPFGSAICCLLLKKTSARVFALVSALGGFALSMVLWTLFNGATAHQMQFEFSLPWIDAYQIRVALGVDGLSLPLVVLTKLMVPIAMLASWKETKHAGAFFASFLFLDFAMTGTFLATDIFLFYVFWELMLIPMILLIGVWGSTERIYASLKFFLYTFAGSILMLTAILWLFAAHQEQMGFYTGNISALSEVVFSNEIIFWGLSTQDLIFWAFTVAFAIKVPLFPLHTWLPDAHVQAPTGGSVLLAAVLLKMGTYGLLRFSIPFCYSSFERFAPLLAVLSLIGILYAAWVAFQQSDMKKLIAYSSVSHLGFVVLGICAQSTEALAGSVIQMVNHGLSTGALFILVGILYDRRHTRMLSDFGGLAKQVPRYAFFLVFVACASMAVPGLNGFVGEFLILLGTFQTHRAWACIAVLGVVFGAVYLLVMIRKVLFGPIHNEANRGMKDVNWTERSTLIPLCLLMFFLGVKPQPFFKKLDSMLTQYWDQHKKMNVTMRDEGLR